MPGHFERIGNGFVTRGVPGSALSHRPKRVWVEVCQVSPGGRSRRICFLSDKVFLWKLSP